MFSSLMRRLVGVPVALAALAFAVSAFAQTGGIEGKCTGEDGKPLVGYTIKVERTEMNWVQHTKTDKKGQYVYIGLTPTEYKITLLSPTGAKIFSITQKVGLGGPDTVDFDMAKEKANAHKDAMANPDTAKKMEADTKDQKAFVGLKQTFDEATALYNQKHFSESAAMFEMPYRWRRKRTCLLCWLEWQMLTGPPQRRIRTRTQGSRISKKPSNLIRRLWR